MVLVVWDVREWARAICDLPVEGPLPTRTVLVPRERVAHGLRRELLRSGKGAVLAGTRFAWPVPTAMEVLRAGGIDPRCDEDAKRSTRLRTLLGTDLPLGHFPVDLLRATPGWDSAFASAIRDLEGAGLRPQDLAKDDRRLADVRTVWEALAASAGTSWTRNRVLVEAAALLGRDPGLWPFDGHVLAVATGHETVAEARFLRAIPPARTTLAVLAARPMRARHLQRLRARFGDAIADAVESAEHVRASSTERDLLASFLFERPDLLADPDRPRSKGPDGTVELEEHAGVEAEVEVAADWVGRQVFAGTPLEEIAVLVPTLDPLAGLLVTRLRRLRWNDGPLPVHVAGGLPAATHGDGARVLAVVRALSDHLSVQALARVLPVLSLARSEGGAGGAGGAGSACGEGSDDRRLSHGAAMDLANSLGTVGGSPARPEGALEWATRAREREREIAERIARVEEDDPRQARGIDDWEDLLSNLCAVRPAVEALVGVARLVVEGAPLGRLWNALRAFLDEWVPSRGAGPRFSSLLDDEVRPHCEDAQGALLSGVDALRVVEESLFGVRVRVGRFGEPAVYVGTVTGAAGLVFRSVRILGLSEGSLPSVGREDPVLPDSVRADLAGTAVPTTTDRALWQLHALCRVIRDTTERVTLSTPRLGTDRSEREPSSILLEAAAALGRSGRSVATVPELRRDAFRPARLAARRFRTESPLSEAAWQDFAARQHRLPAAWREDADLDLHGIREISAPSESGGPMDGILDPAAPAPPMPGLSAKRPISATGLRTFLQCPHRFLLERVLHFEEPAAPRPQRALDPLSYGSLLHRVAERFSRAHGVEFGERKSGLAPWLEKGDAIAADAFASFLREYPLAGAPVRDQELARLRGDFRLFLEQDWTGGEPRGYVDSERGFGFDEPFALSIAGEKLHLCGFVDRLDVVDGTTLVRDLKASRADRRSEGEPPDPVVDVQIGVYGIVARTLAKRWEVPSRVAAAYAYCNVEGAGERSFDEDFGFLEDATTEWLATVARLLRERAFPRTPDSDDCTYCPFVPVCGEDAADRAWAVLQAAAREGRGTKGASAALADFLEIKVPEDGGEDEDDG